MTSAARFFFSMALAMILPGCSGPVSPSLSSTIQINSPLGSLRSESATSSLPVWITEPVVLPDGRVGKNNCTFALPLGYAWDAHPDGGCWEHQAPEGWTRQQSQKIHVPSFPSCGGGPGDATFIRVCRAGGRGQPSPCLIDPITGPNGCARCVINPTCH